MVANLAFVVCVLLLVLDVYPAMRFEAREAPWAVAGVLVAWSLVLAVLASVPVEPIVRASHSGTALRVGAVCAVLVGLVRAARPPTVGLPGPSVCLDMAARTLRSGRAFIVAAVEVPGLLAQVVAPTSNHRGLLIVCLVACGGLAVPLASLAASWGDMRRLAGRPDADLTVALKGLVVAGSVAAAVLA